MSATTAAIISSIAAAISSVCTVLTYRLIRKTQAESEAEERLVAGRPAHPSLREYDHSQAVVFCSVVNRSTKKKAVVTDVLAFDGDGAKIEISWAATIDQLGNPIAPSQPIGITNACDVFARRKDGKWISFAQLKIFHSFKNSPLVVPVDPWQS